VTATRRQVVRTAGGAVLAAPLLARASAALAAATGDEETILGAVRLEQAAVVTYRTGASSGGLDGPATKLFITVAGQEQAHLDAVTKQLQTLGGVVPPLPTPEQVKLGSAMLAGLTTQAQLLGFAADLEQQTIAAYYEAQQALRRAEFLQTTASIMANEGQHLALLRQAMNRPPVPSAFETGKA
jgi:rubrerythrin